MTAPTVDNWDEIAGRLLIRKTAATKDRWRSAHSRAWQSISPEDGERALSGTIAFLNDGFDERHARPGPEVTLGDLVATTHRLVFLDTNIQMTMPFTEVTDLRGQDCKIGAFKRGFIIRVWWNADEFVWTGLRADSARKLFDVLPDHRESR